MADQTETLRAALLSLIEVVETHTFHLKRWEHEQSANYLAEQAAIARAALATPPSASARLTTVAASSVTSTPAEVADD